MKGWNASWWNDYSESSVGFQYVPWKDFEPADEQFSKAAVEGIINRPGSRGRHVVLRLYCEWDGVAETACPSWLQGKGVPRLVSDDGKRIFDFNNSVFLSEAENAIKAFAGMYDNDPRAFAVQLGLLGYWGEWHTFGFKVGSKNYEISDASRTKILSAYKSNFKNAKIVGRYPWQNVLNQAADIGFHNDYFVPGNGHSLEFDKSIKDGLKWLQGPIGGEAPPRDATQQAQESVLMYTTDTGRKMLDDGHYSTMAPGYRKTSGQQYYAEYMAMHKRMGYNFQIKSATFARSLSTSQRLNVSLAVENIGVAPMYYPWQVQFALLRNDDSVVTIFKSAFDPRTLREGSAADLTAGLDVNSFSRGQYRLGVRIIQPRSDMPEAAGWLLNARNAYVVFSNDLPVISGRWDSSVGLNGGWAVLGDLEIR
ncbi:DUF4832 domain-containing protein [Acidovorax sp. BL-A-41-H1]|uniref:DUF4832 domain-containing protein n=1 Tax=Acidovorax sp. BL-A-41-H1 TaxID=3421102 RepID=UPI003F794FC5